MADDKEIGIEANLNQPVAEMEKFQKKLTEVAKGVQNVVKEMELLRDIKVGAVTTGNFDKSQKAILQNFRNLVTLVSTENPGGAIGKALADGISKSFKSNMTSLGRQLTDAALAPFKDAEKQIKNSSLLKLLAEENKGTKRFANNVGTNPGEEKRLELKTRIRAAEMLLAAAEEQSSRQNSVALDKIIAKRDRELALLRTKQQLIDAADAAERKAERARGAAEEAGRRRAVGVMTQNAGIRTTDVIEQNTGIARPAAVEKALESMRQMYAVEERINGQLQVQKKLVEQIDTAYTRAAARRATLMMNQNAGLRLTDVIDQTTGAEKSTGYKKQMSRLQQQYREEEIAALAKEAKDAARDKAIADRAEARRAQFQADRDAREAERVRKSAEKLANAQAGADDMARSKTAATEARRASNQNTDPSRAKELALQAQEAEEIHQRIVAKSQQNMQRLRLFGDGGQFLMEIQARLMLNYKILQSFFSAISYGVQSVVQFDEALHQLQAISGSTKGEMKDLKDIIVGVAESSRYTATQLTQAAVVLAQAGLSTQDIGAALKPITMLAQATGSDLKTSVDVVTSVLGAFNYRAAEAGQIVNIMSGALNTSKLDMEKLALGIQYAGNTAAQANIGFAELTSVIAALSNTGVRSGSTLGTGVTQLISDLINPTDKLKEVLSSLGLTVSDVDVRTKGFTPVLQKLAAAGFGASQAFEGLELRGARAFLGLLGQVDNLEEGTQRIIQSNAAMEGSKIAMESLLAASDRVKANFGVLADKLGAGLKPQIIAVMDAVSELIKQFQGVAATFGSLVIQVAGGAVFALLAMYLGRVMVALSAVGVGLIGFTRNVQTVTSFMGLATGAVYGLSTALTMLKAYWPVLAGFVIFETISAIFNRSSAAANKFTEEMDKLKQKTNEATQANQKQVDAQAAIDKQINELLQKYASLNSNSESLATTTLDLKNRFADLGLELPNTVTNVNELITALQRLKSVSRDAQLVALNEKISSAQGQQKAYQDKLKELTDSKNIDTFMRQNTSSTLSNKVTGSYLGFSRGMDASRFLGGQTKYALDNTQGTMNQVKELMAALMGGDPSKIGAKVAIMQATIDEINKSKKTGKANPNDIMTYEDNVAIGKLLIQRATEVAQIALQKDNAGFNASDAIKQRDQIMESQKDIYQTMNGIIEKTTVEITEMRDQLKNAPIEKQKEIGQKMRDKMVDTSAAIDTIFNAYLDTLSEDQKKIAKAVFRTEQGRAINENKGNVEGAVRASITDVDKVQKGRLELEKANAVTELRLAERRAALYTDSARVQESNKEIIQLTERVIAAQEGLNQIDLDALNTKAKATERAMTVQAQEKQIAALREAARDKVMANLKREMDAVDAGNQTSNSAQIGAVNASVNTVMASLTGPLGKDMTAAQKEKISEELGAATEKLISLRIRSVIAKAGAAGDLNDPVVSAQLTEETNGIIQQEREKLEQRRLTIQNNIIAQEEREVSESESRAKGILENQKKRLQMELKNIEDQNKNYVEEKNINDGVEKMLVIQKKLIETQKALNELALNNQRGKLDAVDRERLMLEQESELTEQKKADAQKIRDEQKRALDRALQQEMAAAKSTIDGINSTINAHMASISGMLGKGMSKEAKDRILAQVELLTEQLITIQIQSMIKAMAVTGQDPDGPDARAQGEGIITAARENLKKWKSSFDKSDLASNNDAMSNELKQILADFQVELKKLAQNFKQIDKALANANLAAENIQFKFDADLKAYDAPVNRNNFTSAYKEVDQFEKSAQIEQEVRQLKINAAKIAIANQTTGMQEAEKLIGSLMKEKVALEGVVGANNANNSALAAVKQQLQTAEGEMERYRQQIDGTSEALKRMETEQQAQTQPKPKPTFFEQLNTGFKAWEIQNKQFQTLLTQLAEKVPQILNTVSGSFADAVVSMVDGTKSVGQAFGDMARSVVKSLLQMVVQMLATAAIKMALKFLFPGAGLALSSGGSVPDSSSVGGGTGGGYGTYRAGGMARKRFAGGGQNRDSINAVLMPGEFVLRRAAARSIGRDTLDHINNMGNRKLSEPMGAVGDFGNEMADQRTADRSRKKEGEQNVTNVWIVPEGQQPPPPSAKDIVAIVNSDIVRGGQTRVLIKSIVNGRG